MNHTIMNLDKINPIKREKIKKGMEYIASLNDGCISKVIAFGSSVTQDCTEESDIDLCFITMNPDSDIYSQIYGNMEIVMDDLCDILDYDELKGEVKTEIDKKGVAVYEYYG